MVQVTIRVKVLYFAEVRDAAGTYEESYTLLDGATVAELLSRISSSHQKIGKIRRMIKAAVNEDMAEPDHPLQDRDTVALFPPIAGG